MDDLNHLVNLRDEYFKRLKVREIQAAKLGVNADPIVITEINEYRSLIESLDRKISKFNASTPKTNYKEPRDRPQRSKLDEAYEEMRIKKHACIPR